MKKTYFTSESTSEAYALYVGIDAVYGGWIMETGGDPTCLNELEEAVSNGVDGAEANINAINEIIASQATPWEDLDEEDLEYIQEWLEIWGLR